MLQAVQVGENDRDDLRRFAAGVREIAAAEGVAYAPAFEDVRAWIDNPDHPALALLNNSGLRATYDGVHMAPAGDRVLARATLKGLGLDADELSRAEAAWNADDTLVPLIAPPSSMSKITVRLTDAEARAVSGLTLKQILDRGIPSLAANPTIEVEGVGALTVMTVTPSTGTFSYKAYDQLLLAARILGIRVDEAIRCAILRGARGGTMPSPGPPVAVVNDVLAGEDRATFDATVSSVGATASSCRSIASSRAALRPRHLRTRSRPPARTTRRRSKRRSTRRHRRAARCFWAKASSVSPPN